MNRVTCASWQELLAMRAMGDPEARERTDLLRHVEGCPDCQEIEHEFNSVRHALSFVSTPSAFSSEPLSPDLTKRVMDLCSDDEVTQRRRVRYRVAGSIGLVAASLIAITVSFLGTSGAPLQQRVEALVGLSSASAQAKLTAEPWGTSIILHEQGLAGPGTYTVEMKTGAGTWWTAGTYRSVAGQPIDAVMACAVALKEITGVRIIDASGSTVLSSYGSQYRAPVG